MEAGGAGGRRCREKLRRGGGLHCRGGAGPRSCILPCPQPMYPRKRGALCIWPPALALVHGSSLLDWDGQGYSPGGARGPRVTPSHTPTSHSAPHTPSPRDPHCPCLTLALPRLCHLSPSLSLLASSLSVAPSPSVSVSPRLCISLHLSLGLPLSPQHPSLPYFLWVPKPHP